MVLVGRGIHIPHSAHLLHTSFYLVRKKKRAFRIGIAMLSIVSMELSFVYTVNLPSETNSLEECISLMLDGYQSMHWKHTLKITRFRGFLEVD